MFFSQFCGEKESQIVHFACHAEAEENVFKSYLTVADDFDIELLDMRVHKCQMNGNPLVVLNACGTGIRDSRGSFGFVWMFFECGGRGIIATECDIPDAFSAAFAENFYNRLLEGEMVGKALLETRLFFLNEHRNPLGLLYATYAAMETRLVKEPS
jgi:CHAT domain-containing protein